MVNAILDESFQQILRFPLDNAFRLAHCDRLEEQGQKVLADRIRLAIKENKPPTTQYVDPGANVSCLDLDRGIMGTVSVRFFPERNLPFLFDLVKYIPLTRIFVSPEFRRPAMVQDGEQAFWEWRTILPSRSIEQGCYLSARHAEFFGLPPVCLEYRHSCIRFTTEELANEWLSRNMINYCREQVVFPAIQEWIDTPILPIKIRVIE